MNKLGTRIQFLRVMSGLSQAELGTKLHTHSSVVSNWEAGRCLPRTRYIPQLARVLGCEASELAELWMSDSMEKEG